MALLVIRFVLYLVEQSTASWNFWYGLMENLYTKIKVNTGFPKLFTPDGLRPCR